MHDPADIGAGFSDGNGLDQSEDPLEAHGGDDPPDSALADSPAVLGRLATDADRASRVAAKRAASPKKIRHESASGLIPSPTTDRTTDAFPGPDRPFICARSSSGADDFPCTSGQSPHLGRGTISTHGPGTAPCPPGTSCAASPIIPTAAPVTDAQLAPAPRSKRSNSRSSATSVQVIVPKQSADVAANVAMALLRLIQRVMDRRTGEAPTVPEEISTPPE